jgi:hypothetical protein
MIIILKIHKVFLDIFKAELIFYPDEFNWTFYRTPKIIRNINYFQILNLVSI